MMHVITEFITIIIEMLFGTNNSIMERVLGLLGILISIFILFVTTMLIRILIMKLYRITLKKETNDITLNITGHEHIPEKTTVTTIFINNNLMSVPMTNSEKYITYLTHPQTGYDYEINDAELYFATIKNKQPKQINASIVFCYNKKDMLKHSYVQTYQVPNTD